MNNGTFQTSVQIQPAVGIAGNFASANPRATANAGDGAFVAGANGLVVGNFAWVDAYTNQANSYTLTGGAPAGFVANEMQATISTWFDGYANRILAGQAVTLFSDGDFWAKPVTQAIRGQAVFARFTDGAIMTAAAGSSVAGFTSTASSIAASATNTFTGAIAQTVSPSGGYGMAVLTASAVTGTIVIGSTLSGTNVVSGTTVLAQLSGTAGGAGTYEVSIAQTVASTTITGTSGVLTVGGTVGGTVMVGAVLSGGTVAAGVTVTAFGTGVGAAGTYIVSSGTVVTSAALAGTGAVQTQFVVESNCAAGELCKISTWG